MVIANLVEGHSHLPPTYGVVRNWFAPHAGVYKINTDTAIQEKDQVVGVGVIIRDLVGQVMAMSTQKVAAFFSPPVAEASVILRGFQFETDSAAVLEIDANEWLI
ncbi:hypothetical protein Dsin_005209 [Dipteronia sinensis]|uniref:RNase H type-1 domain-containing protein n=1 Tax=Dipteronia sinensis TaxID=43782 RepID=A0AAE0AWG6_9ROSI|nr:hypothetical protein Dsin_005209 [Dipteronia sinensis]